LVLGLLPFALCPEPYASSLLTTCPEFVEGLATEFFDLGIPEIKLFSYQLYRICSIMAQFPNPPIPQFLNPVCGSLLWTSK
jgi:hypothetical protein